MPIRDLAGSPAPESLSRKLKGVGSWAGPLTGEFRRVVMVKCSGISDKPSSMVAPVCDRLRALFDEVAEEPIPDLLTNLADRLDSALERGDLCQSKLDQPKR